jgi:deoxycytidylate deaminase
MNTTLTTNCVRLARNLVEVVEKQTWKHFSFICRRNTVYSIGWNNCNKTHPLAYKHNYKFNAIHSELHAIIKFNCRIRDFSKFCVINVRLDKYNKVRMSKPCHTCQKLLYHFGVKNVWYSNNVGLFDKLY